MRVFDSRLFSYVEWFVESEVGMCFIVVQANRDRQLLYRTVEKIPALPQVAFAFGSDWPDCVDTLSPSSGP
jgi:hypothetical protein